MSNKEKVYCKENIIEKSSNGTKNDYNNTNNIIDNNKINNINDNKIYNICNDNDKNKLSIINNIKSLYLLNIIFNFIDIDNFSYKLFKYSKFHQIRFNLDSYKEKYQIQEFLKDAYRESIFSPLFQKIIANNTIYIFLKNGWSYEKLKDKYNQLLNQSDIKYSSIYFIFDDNTNILKELNIDFNKIIKITLHKGNDFQTDNNVLFQTLFSLKNIENNLLSLTIYFRWNEEEFTSFLKRKPSKNVNPDLFEKINDLTALRYLHLFYVDFENKVTIKLKNLKYLYCLNCKNLNLSGIICPKLEILYFLSKEKQDFKDINIQKLTRLKELYINNSKNNILEDVKKLKKVFI